MTVYRDLLINPSIQSLLLRMFDPPKTKNIDIDGQVLTTFYFTSGEIVYVNDLLELHRLAGPAYINGTFRCWYKNNMLHNTNGPAIDSGFPNNKDWIEYWVDGCNIGEICFQLKFKNLSQKEIIKLLYRKDASLEHNQRAIAEALIQSGLTRSKTNEIIKRVNIINSLTEKDNDLFNPCSLYVQGDYAYYSNNGKGLETINLKKPDPGQFAYIVWRPDLNEEE